jgi:2-polyprenyl-3-methyl-5-hydroxy-6-metoxy-1,4-benzoquinol methylase
MNRFISKIYQELNQECHQQQRGYGARGNRRAELIHKYAKYFKAEEILDYGCGKGSLAISLPQYNWIEYDPAIPGKDRLPTSADMVVCADVLEHIEPDKLDAVLDHVFSLIKFGAVIIVCQKQGKRRLPDGSFAHRIIMNANEWHITLQSYADIYGFEVILLSNNGKDATFIVKE